jgi:small subunit ribosomal protein S5
MARNTAQETELQERVVYINRVSKVVKGGRRFSLSALVVVGDGEGRIGIGMGKSTEVPNAIKKAIDDAKKNMCRVPIVHGTFPHEMMGEFGSARIVLKPAAPGCGITAGGPARAVLELAGYTDVLTKSLGSPNPINVVKATAEGLKNMQFSREVAKRRNLTMRELFNIKPAVATKTTEALEVDAEADVVAAAVAADAPQASATEEA